MLKQKGSKRKISCYDQTQKEAYNALKELQAENSRNRYVAFKSIFSQNLATDMLEQTEKLLNQYILKMW